MSSEAGTPHSQSSPDSGGPSAAVSLEARVLAQVPGETLPRPPLGDRAVGPAARPRALEAQPPEVREESQTPTGASQVLGPLLSEPNIFRDELFLPDTSLLLTAHFCTEEKRGRVAVLVEPKHHRRAPLDAP